MEVRPGCDVVERPQVAPRHEAAPPGRQEIAGPADGGRLSGLAPDAPGVPHTQQAPLGDVQSIEPPSVVSAVQVPGLSRGIEGRVGRAERADQNAAIARRRHGARPGRWRQRRRTQGHERSCLQFPEMQRAVVAAAHQQIPLPVRREPFDPRAVGLNTIGAARVVTHDLTVVVPCEDATIRCHDDRVRLAAELQGSQERARIRVPVPHRAVVPAGHELLAPMGPRHRDDIGGVSGHAM